MNRRWLAIPLALIGLGLGLAGFGAFGFVGFMLKNITIAPTATAETSSSTLSFDTPIFYPVTMEGGFAPAFSPNGENIYYLTPSGALARASTSGSTEPVILQQLEPAPILIWAPHADEALVIWQTSAEGGTSLDWLDVESGQQEHLADDVWAAAWLPTGEQITYAKMEGTNCSLWLSNPHTGRAEQLTTLSLVAPQAISWSPHLDRLLVQGAAGTAVLAVEGDIVTQIEWLDWAQNAEWSPDGQMIAFRYRDQNGDTLYIADNNGAQQSIVLTAPSLLAHWSHDGRLWYMIPNDEGGVSLWAFDPRTEARELIADAAVLRWRPVDDFAIAPQSNMIVYQAQDGEIWLLKWTR